MLKQEVLNACPTYWHRKEAFQELWNRKILPNVRIVYTARKYHYK